MHDWQKKCEQKEKDKELCREFPVLPPELRKKILKKIEDYFNAREIAKKKSN